jgi:WD40 repeat protein
MPTQLAATRLSTCTALPEQGGMPAVQPTTVLRGHHGEVQCVEFAQSSEVLLSGDSEGQVRVWHLDTARSVTTDAHGSNAGVLQLQCLGTGSIASQGRDGEVKFWHLQQSGTLQSAGSLPSNGFHFCKCRAHSHPSLSGSGAQCVPAQSLTTYEAELRTFCTWDMRSRELAIRTTIDKQYGTSMCVHVDTCTSAPILVCGCAPSGAAAACAHHDRLALNHQSRVVHAARRLPVWRMIISQCGDISLLFPCVLTLQQARA